MIGNIPRCGAALVSNLERQFFALSRSATSSFLAKDEHTAALNVLACMKYLWINKLFDCKSGDQHASVLAEELFLVVVDAEDRSDLSNHSLVPACDIQRY